MILWKPHARLHQTLLLHFFWRVFRTVLSQYAPFIATNLSANTV